jgi:nucleoid DNA-binding protein
MSQSYTRSDLAAELSQKAGCTVDGARTTVEHVLSSVTTALSSGKKVEFRGFGVLEVVKRKEKVGRNPKGSRAGHVSNPVTECGQVQNRQGTGRDPESGSCVCGLIVCTTLLRGRPNLFSAFLFVYDVLVT